MSTWPRGGDRRFPGRDRVSAASRLLAGAALGILSVAPSANGVCCPFGGPDGWIQTQGQLNLVDLTVHPDSIRLVPNIRITGETAQFALVVPTPALPSLAPEDGNLWNEAFALTRPRGGVGGGSSGFLGCSQSDVIAVAEPGVALEGGVIVHGTETVGAFNATIVSSDDPDALVTWLRDNDFTFTAEDSTALAGFALRDWFFTAMKVDTTQVQMPPFGGWNVNVDPVSFTYEATDLEVPLPILAINRAPRMPMTFFVVAEHRMALEDFDTEYVNRLSVNEHAAIAERHPTLAEHLAPDDVFTRLGRTFDENDPMSASIFLTQGPNDDELWPTFGRAAIPVGALTLVGIGIGFPVLARRRRR